METVRSGHITYNNSKTIEGIVAFVKAALWLCLVLMPWVLLAGLGYITGIIELSSWELNMTVLMLLGAVLQIILCSQK